VNDAERPVPTCKAKRFFVRLAFRWLSGNGKSNSKSSEHWRHELAKPKLHALGFGGSAARGRNL